MTVEHVEDGVIVRQEDQLGNEPDAVFIPYDRLDAVIEMMRPRSTPKLVE